MRYVDLSHPVATGMPVYPGDPEVRVEPALSLAHDGVAVARLRLGSHAGTHLDAPAHSVPGGRTVDRVELDRVCGEARVLRVAGALPAQRLEAADIVGGLPGELPERVLVATGWDRCFHDPRALDHPYLSLELAEALWDRGARLLGVDALSPDRTGPAEGPDREAQDHGFGEGAAMLPVHELWLGRDGLIVENLTGLGALPDLVEVSLLPLRLDGGDGSPVRAVARIADAEHPPGTTG